MPREAQTSTTHQAGFSRATWHHYLLTLGWPRQHQLWGPLGTAVWSLQWSAPSWSPHLPSVGWLHSHVLLWARGSVVLACRDRSDIAITPTGAEQAGTAEFRGRSEGGVQFTAPLLCTRHFERRALTQFLPQIHEAGLIIPGHFTQQEN